MCPKISELIGTKSKCANNNAQKVKKNKKGITMAVLNAYNINAMATQISREFYIDDKRPDDSSHVLVDEMRLFAMDMKSRVTFISRVRK